MNTPTEFDRELRNLEVGVKDSDADNYGIFSGKLTPESIESIKQAVDKYVIGGNHSCNGELQPASMQWSHDHGRWVEGFNFAKSAERRSLWGDKRGS